MKRQVRSQNAVIFFAALMVALCLAAPYSAAATGDGPAAPSDQDVKSLGSPTPAERKKAEENIQKSGPDAITPLLNGLDDSNQSVRERAAWWLRQISYQFKSLPNDMVAGQIVRRVHSEKDYGARFEMVRALRDYPGPTALSELKRVAEDDSAWDIRLYAIHYVAESSSDPSKEIAFFKKRTTDSNKAVQLAVYSELARLGDKSERNLALQTLDKSSDWYERREATGILGAVGNTADLPLLQGIIDSKNIDADSRLIVVHAYQDILLSQIAEKGRLDFLIKSLDDPSWDVRDWAYVRLWKFKDPSTNLRLKAYLHEKGHRGYDEAANALQLR